MRLLLLILFVGLSSYSIAQNSQLQVRKVPKLNGKELTVTQMSSLLKLYNSKLQNGTASVTPKLNPGITYLTDGMPCIVPEEPTAGKIPNAFKGIQSYTIPNPARPKETKPGEKIKK